MEPIILASASPRRQEFFRLLGLPFTCIPAEIDETLQPGLSPRQAAEAIARQKVAAVVEKITQTPDWGAAQEEYLTTEFHGGNKRFLTKTPCYSVTSVVNSYLSDTPFVFGADTIVVLEGEIFGKPADKDAAKAMLGRLSDRPHEVITAMALYRPDGNTDCRSVSVQVRFAPLSPAEIEWYLGSGEWEGAAGAYQLQGLGGCLIESINGSPSGVAGLPLHDFYVMLRENGYRFGA